MFLTNNQLTFIELPNGVQIMPKETMPIDDAAAEALSKHPCTGLWLRHGLLTLSDGEGKKVEQEPTSDERLASSRAALQKSTKMARIAAATSGSDLAAMAAQEKDPEVIKAINERLTSLTENGNPLKFSL